MKTAREIFPKDPNDNYEYFGDYQPILEEFGEILLQVDDDDYQGDSRVLYKGGEDRYGYLNFGWGSCSGCDALQACDNIEEVQELIDSMFKEIKWFSSREDTLKFFKEYDWETQYEWHLKETKRFVKEAIEKLEVVEST